MNLRQKNIGYSFLRTSIKIFGVFLILLIAISSKAQNISVASQTIKIKMGGIIDIKFLANNLEIGTPLSLVFSKASDYYNGVESAQQTLKVRSNQDFTVSVRTANISNSERTPSFVYIKVPQNNTGGQVGSSFNNSVYQKLSDNDLVLLEEGKKGDNQTFSVQYKAKPGSMVTPGIYTVNVVFTATRY